MAADTALHGHAEGTELRPDAPAFRPASGGNSQHRQPRDPHSFRPDHDGHTLQNLRRPRNPNASAGPPANQDRRHSGDNSARPADIIDKRSPPEQRHISRHRRGPGRSNNDTLTSSRRAVAEREDDEEDATCVICCERFQVVAAIAVGKCNHKEVCARCSLRMRLCYDDTKCPLCKTELQDVVMVAWRKSGMPDWKDFEGRRQELWSNRSWARGVLVEKTSIPSGAATARPLSIALQGMTGRACSICDKLGNRLFPSNKSLMRHTEHAHNRYLCETCLTVCLSEVHVEFNVAA